RHRTSTLLPYTTLFRSTSDKIIKLEEHRTNRGDGLSPVEQAAFREIARQLDSVVHREPDEPQAPEEPVSVADETRTDALTPDPRSEEHTSELQSRENLV